jgi:hypothetical protein
MSDDEEEKLRGTIKYADAGVDDAEELFDATDLIELIEEGDDLEQATSPLMRALAEATRQHDVPSELLWRAMRPDEGWITCHAMVGRNGLIRLSAEAYDKLVPGERVEVRIRRLKKNVEGEDEG